MAMILTALVRFDQILQTLRFDQGSSRIGDILRADRRRLFERSPQAEHTHLETHERHLIVLLVRMHGSLIGAFGGTLNPSGVELDPNLDLKAPRLKKRLLCGTIEDLAG